MFDDPVKLLAGLAGEPVRVEHVDGAVEEPGHPGQAAAGPSGLAYAPQPFPQPGFDGQAPLAVRVEGWSGRAGWRLLDGESFERACLDWRAFRAERRALDLGRPLTLPPCAVATIGGPP